MECTARKGGRCLRSHLLELLQPAGASAFVQRLRRGLEHPVSVLQQQPAVPGQEEVSILAVPVAALADKEARLPRGRVVVAGIVWRIVAPADGRGPELLWPSSFAAQLVSRTLPLRNPLPCPATLYTEAGMHGRHLPAATQRAAQSSRPAAAASSPLWPAHALRVAPEVCQHVLVIALKLPHSGKPPPAIPLRVGWIPQLPCRAQPNGDLCQAGSCSKGKAVSQL